MIGQCRDVLYIPIYTPYIYILYILLCILYIPIYTPYIYILYILLYILYIPIYTPYIYILYILLYILYIPIYTPYIYILYIFLYILYIAIYTPLVMHRRFQGVLLKRWISSWFFPLVFDGIPTYFIPCLLSIQLTIRIN